MEINATLVQVDLEKHAIIADSQFELASALQSFMRETLESRAHLVHLALHSFTGGAWQGIKRFGECRRPDLKCCRHELLWLARSVATSGDFRAGLVQLGLHFIRQLKLILKVIVDPLADLLNFFTRQVWDRRLNLFDRAHANNLAQSSPMRREKPRSCERFSAGSPMREVAKARKHFLLVMGRGIKPTNINAALGSWLWAKNGVQTLRTTERVPCMLSPSIFFGGLT